MAQFVIVYTGVNKSSSQEEGKQHFEKYKEWLSNLGDTVISPANPLMHTQTIKPNGMVNPGSESRMSG